MEKYLTVSEHFPVWLTALIDPDLYDLNILKTLLVAGVSNFLTVDPHNYFLQSFDHYREAPWSSGECCGLTI